MIWGLSPRVRGSQQPRELRHARPGSIPAGTGKPFEDVFRTNLYRVYPRGYGEASVAGSSVPTDNGLSPRVRGSREKMAPRPS